MIALLDLGEHLARELTDVRGLRRYSDPATVPANDSETAAVLIGPTIRDPIAISRRFGGRNIPIVICAEPDKIPALQRAVLFTPLIPSDIALCPSDDLGRLTEAVNRAADRTRKRRRYQAHIRAANMALATAPAKPAPNVPLDRLLEVAPMGVITTTPDGNAISWNRRASDMLGGQQLEPGRPIHSLFDPECGEILQELLRSEGTRRITREDQHFAAHAGHFLSAGGERGVVILLEDVTEQVHTEQARAEAEKHSRFLAEQAQHAAERIRRINEELEQFAFVASHDLQEPLRTVASFAQLLARHYKDQLSAEADDYIVNILQGAKRMQALIQDLLDYSRVGRDEDLETTEVDMNKVFGEVVNALGAAIGESGGTVTRDSLPVLSRANESQMTQLLSNLLSNAIKYRAYNVSPKIHVRAVRRGTFWQFSVSDNGQGFPQEYEDRIFGVFKRLHGRDVPGTGIGLALCKRIVERHGGRIWVQSTPEVGSTFFFSIPM